MSKPFVPVVIVGVQVAGEAAAVKSQLDSLINTIDKSTFDVAELLYTVKVKGFYSGWGFSTFQEYAASFKKLKKRRVQYLTRMVGVMDTVGIKREVYEPLGIARLREITSLDPEIEWTNPQTNIKTPMVEFIKGFVEKGEEIEMDQLKQHVRTLKGFVGENDLVFETLCMTRSAMDNSWKPAIELAKAKIGTVGKDDEGMSVDASTGAAAEMLAVAFLTDPQNEQEAYTPDDEEVALDGEEEDNDE